MGRAKLFYGIALMLESYVQLPCGIMPDPGDDEHRIVATLFVPFFERVWEAGWIAEERGGFLNSWAAHAAGMIENITLKPRKWIDRNGVALKVARYMRPDEFPP